MGSRARVCVFCHDFCHCIPLLVNDDDAPSQIVRAKHQARLTAKRQQAITTHLGRVLETTEAYTRWLTEDISGKKNAAGDDSQPAGESTSDMPESSTVSTDPSEKRDRQRHRKHRAAQAHSASSSDEEYSVRLLVLYLSL